MRHHVPLPAKVQVWSEEEREQSTNEVERRGAGAFCVKALTLRISETFVQRGAVKRTHLVAYD